mmetsp:Transcript_28502/g.28872  ORF Transcript_28502/g.28872 Transcript_28502/m.28872 type:complete len:259 (+) Transcript_28502:68-844(+)
MILSPPLSVKTGKLRPWSSTLIVVLVATLALCCHQCTGKKNRDVFHGHRGILPPYEAGPFESLDLNKGDEKVLESGKSIMKQNLGSGDELGGGAICVQDVAAPKEAVWSQILDLDSYKGKVPKVNECKNYFVKKNKDGTIIFKTKMAVKVIPGYGYTSFYDHTYNPTKDSMTWRLDYDKKSDFDDVSGHWHLEEHPTKPECTRVFYACDIKLKGAVPGPVVNFVSKSALKAATSWVKKESEKSPKAKSNPAFVDKSKV